MTRAEAAPLITGKILNIGGMMRRDADRMLQPFDLNQQQFSILFAIGREKRVNQTNMVNQMVLEKAHVSKVVKKLHRLGLIGIEPCREDRRSAWLSLTPEGDRVLRECRSLIAEWNGAWTEEMTLKELQRLLEGLTRLQEVLKKKLERP